jgi:hypothetical protein
VAVPLDEYPIHQLPISMAYLGTSDRNFYDRSYFNAYDRATGTFLATGLGVYPNLGVMDAYVVVRQGDRQWAVRFSDALSDNRLDQRIGPYRIEVLEPLHRIRVGCDADDLGIGLDLTWEGAFPVVQEQNHTSRTGRRATIQASRMAQVGTWTGDVRFGGTRLTARPETWFGGRDRSWGVRAVGEPVPPGRAAEEPFQGFWWTYVTLRFPEFALVILSQEEPDGHRTQNDAVRVFADGRTEQLGWPEYDIRYRPGTRVPEHATIHLRARNGQPVTVEIDPLTALALHLGGGYHGGDEEWGHGRWKGRGWSSGRSYDLTDPDVTAKVTSGVVDHAARARCDGAEGWGLFEHGTMGRHDPSGFADFRAVAP